ncbi:MAG: Na+/H+ antiporter NhaC family protein [Kiritimatiellae bacterium]|nr:Na+/H+ antiporter NhaC family protein [Kiritimatiellia bacterium]
MKRKPVWALLPFAVLLAACAGMFAAGSVSMPAAFLAAGAVALCTGREPFAERIKAFAEGMGHEDVMIMCMVFVLAGAFASAAKESGAVDAMVKVAQTLVPVRFLAAGVFVVSCAVSLAVGTSCGTIAAVGPVAFALAGAEGASLPVMAGAVVGGAMFGDNLSVISDTTIAATRTQKVAMREKFLANLKPALAAAVATGVFYLAIAPGAGAAGNAVAAFDARDFVLIAPYIVVFAAAVAGVNVMAVLCAGTLLALAAGMACGAFGCGGAVDCVGKGIMSMTETLVVALLAGGLFALVKKRGGIGVLVDGAGRFVKSPRSCEIAACVLTGTINLFTANNTVAIVVAGPLAAEWRERTGASARRIAGLLDTASCVVQGLIPYGAQVLIATGIAKGFDASFNVFALTGSLVYPVALASAVAVWIAIGAKRERIPRNGKFPLA